MIAASALASAEAAPPLAGSWTGSYTCGQGLTAMTLDLAETKTGRVNGVMTFYAHPKNPGVPTGCFTLSGAFDSATGELVLRQDRWIKQPDAFWYMVDLDGRVDRDAYAGRVLFAPQPEACTTFALRRTIARPPTPACGAGALTS
jgi:hypothetical protein